MFCLVSFFVPYLYACLQYGFRQHLGEKNRQGMLLLLQKQINPPQIFRSRIQLKVDSSHFTSCSITITFHIKSLTFFLIIIMLKESASVEMEEERKGGSSPRGVLEDCAGSLESETAFPKASTSDSEAQLNARSAAQWHKIFHVFKKAPAMGFQTLPSLGIRKLSRSKSRRARDSMIPSLYPSLDVGLCMMKPSWKAFSLSDLQKATNNFSAGVYSEFSVLNIFVIELNLSLLNLRTENLIGEGGYAEVYKGQLADGQFVAIKRLTRGTPEEMTADFLSELGIIAHVSHANTAKLVGYSVEGGMHLVLYLSLHGSLASILYCLFIIQSFEILVPDTSPGQK